MSLPSAVEASLCLPWSRGDRSQSQASCPQSLVTLCQSPGTSFVPPPPWNAPAPSWGAGVLLLALTPNSLSHFREVFLPQNMG